MRREGLDIPVIVVSGTLGELTAVECIKQGAADYVLKDDLPRLPESIRRALNEKRLRDDNKQAQQDLARSNQDLEQFAYVASHDLQEPLRMVATYTQLLADRYHGQLDANADKYIQYAVDGALRMQTLVQDLLTFSRVGRQDTDLQSIDCNGVVAMAMRNLQDAISESGAQILCDPLPVICGDGSQLQQVFQNLIGNAIKFRESEPLVIRVSAVQGREDMGLLGGRQRHRHRSRTQRNHLRHLQAAAYPRRISGQRDWPVDLQKDHRTARREDLG